MKRLCWVPAPALFNLNMACALINESFDGYDCYLVGSALQKRDYRDVDVRLILRDEVWDRLFGSELPGRPDMNPLWSLMCSSISVWLQTQTGLPVDFQIQRATQANEEFGTDKPEHSRHHLGMFLKTPLATPRDYADTMAMKDGR